MLSAKDIDLVYSMWQRDFNMEKLLNVKSNNFIGRSYTPDCFLYNGYILRIDFWNNMLIIESADSLEQAQLNDYEDGYTYDSDQPISDILNTMKLDIISDFGQAS